ncbi:hypothetical protein D9M68_882050 [compost metagenome]
MNDQLSIVAANYKRSKAWYQAVLAPLGHELKSDGDNGQVRVAEFGPVGSEQVVFRLVSATLERGVGEASAHLCLRANCQEAVRAFHTAALLAGGEDNGMPGVRPGQNAYAALVFDPDGYHVEAACLA